MANNVMKGKGTKIRVALLPEGSREEPVAANITSAASSTAAGTTTITLTGTLGAGVLIPAGSYLPFIAPTTGKTVPVRLTADAEEGDSSLAVAAIPEAIAASSVAAFPTPLKGRTAANLSRSTTDVTRTDFDSDGYSDGTGTSLEQGLDIPGSYLPTDAGYLTLEYAQENLREVWIEYELPRPSALYSKGKIYKGVCSVMDLPLDNSAEGVIDSNGTLKWRGKPIKVDPVPVA